MKIVAETTGNFMLWGGQRNEVVEADQVNVVHADQFWQRKVSEGALEVHGHVNMDVTDADLQAALKDVKPEGRREAAIAFAKKHKFDPNKKVVDEVPLEQQIVDAKTKLQSMQLPDSKASEKEKAEQTKLIAELEDKQLNAPRK